MHGKVRLGRADTDPAPQLDATGSADGPRAPCARNGMILSLHERQNGGSRAKGHGTARTADGVSCVGPSSLPCPCGSRRRAVGDPSRILSRMLGHAGVADVPRLLMPHGQPWVRVEDQLASLEGRHEAVRLGLAVTVIGPAPTLLGPESWRPLSQYPCRHHREVVPRLCNARRQRLVAVASAFSPMNRKTPRSTAHRTSVQAHHSRPNSYPRPHSPTLAPDSIATTKEFLGLHS
jgi:hypothetical protein